MIHVLSISHIITIHTHAQVLFMNSLTLIHTGAQVGPYPDRTQLPSITLSFKPTWGHSHIHSFYKSSVKYKNDTQYENIPFHRY